jgi:hypothetical protein
MTYTDIFTLSSLPTFNGIAFRADTGYCHGKEQKAIDVINFEEKELGNTDTKHLTLEIRKQLSKYPAKDIVWVTKLKKDAKKYGIVDRVYDLGKTPKIIAEDGDGGYLLLKDIL